MKILYIITNLNLGGAEVQLYKLVENLKNDHKIKVISLLSKGDIGDNLVKLGVELRIIDFSKKRWMLISFLELCSAILKFKPDVVHTWMYHANLIGGLAAKVSRVRNILWSIHHNDLSVAHNKLSTVIIARIGAFISNFVPIEVICVSNDSIKRHIKFGYNRKKMIFIPNGIDVIEFSYINNARKRLFSDYDFPDDAKLIGFASRFDPIKNHEGFFACIADIRITNPQINMQIILSGKNIDKNNIGLVTMINKYDLFECVHLMGLIDDMPVFMSSLDLIVSTSFSEAFSLVLAEALSCETLCVTSIEGDTEEVVEGIGKRVPARNLTLLSNAIITMLNIGSLEKSKLKLKGRDKIKSLYSTDIVFDKYKGLYSKYYQQTF
tara:strand:+ start:12276 stop:13415 length:1140 start_codon:yes stop_codon:yes gene_type:complete